MCKVFYMFVTLKTKVINIKNNPSKIKKSWIFSNYFQIQICSSNSRWRYPRVVPMIHYALRLALHVLTQGCMVIHLDVLSPFLWNLMFFVRIKIFLNYHNTQKNVGLQPRVQTFEDEVVSTPLCILKVPCPMTMHQHSMRNDIMLLT